MQIFLQVIDKKRSVRKKPFLDFPPTNQSHLKVIHTPERRNRLSSTNQPSHLSASPSGVWSPVSSRTPMPIFFPNFSRQSFSRSLARALRGATYTAWYAQKNVQEAHIFVYTSTYVYILRSIYTRCKQGASRLYCISQPQKKKSKSKPGVLFAY